MTSFLKLVTTYYNCFDYGIDSLRKGNKLHKKTKNDYDKKNYNNKYEKCYDMKNITNKYEKYYGIRFTKRGKEKTRSFTPWSC